MVCGAAGIVLSRLIADRTGIPLQIGGPGEHLELEIGLFNPGLTDSGAASDHTYLRYYNGEDKVFYIDPTYDLIWGDAPAVTEPIVEQYGLAVIDEALQEEHSLYPFTVELADCLRINLWGSMGIASPTQLQDYYDLRAAMHDERSFKNTIVTNSGRRIATRTFWGERTARVLRAVDALTGSRR